MPAFGLSRRKLLTRVATVVTAAVPVAVLPAIAEAVPVQPVPPAAPLAPAVQSTAPDPILAAIEEERRLYWQWSSLSDQLEAARDKVGRGDPLSDPAHNLA